MTTVPGKGGSIMIDTATIIPTGDEIKAGIVFDTDSAAVVQQLVHR